ncbi:hypothetical protein CK503_08990 [Aliifodinibius salipaludis]|uniref:DUF2480 domain-containing protein n=1 Tax=Fodinibius salipaludis TaxID=2032627 RepID=A0A2A2G9F5_9BACT|nr:DUF2480 family protein [Aliifodinibius salipaludis]PAU93800.1 hypothetical protein CK503_08990 [Aliifodinibius salipaludis]
MATDTKGEIVNKVKQSDKLVTIDLQKYFDDTSRSELDLKQFLFKGMILKEQDFRDQLEQFDWSQFEDQYVAVYCSTDAIISKWAYMLVGQYLASYAKEVFMGRKDDMLFELYRRKLNEVDWSSYKNKFVILKGCSSKEKPVPESVYLYATQRLVPHVKKLMYGEACSNVPVYRA